MRRIGDMISDLLSGDPRIAIGLGVVLGIVVLAALYAKATRAKRMKAQAKFVRKRG